MLIRSAKPQYDDRVPTWSLRRRVRILCCHTAKTYIRENPTHRFRNRKSFPCRRVDRVVEATALLRGFRPPTGTAAAWLVARWFVRAALTAVCARLVLGVTDPPLGPSVRSDDCITLLTPAA